jgi:putative oxidoreductase
MQNPMGWMGPMESAPPGVLQAVAAIFEFAGGVLVLLGLATRVGALALVSVMIGALALVHIPKGDPYVAQGKVGAELATLYLTISLLLAAIGPGAYSLDALIFGRGLTSPSRGGVDR